MLPDEGTVLLIDKPLEWTSFDVVNKLRYALRIRKIGHAGTLDPLATGLLILCTGKMTKRIDEFQAQEKEYTGEMVLGQTTPSYDLETMPSAAVDISHVTAEDLVRLSHSFTGKIQQVPPAHSSVKVDGKRAYDLARRGKTPQLEPREVSVHLFELTRMNFPRVSFKVVCSKGTYIRSLVHDFGQALGTGAYLSALRRTRIGNYRVEDAVSVDEAAQAAHVE